MISRNNMYDAIRMKEGFEAYGALKIECIEKMKQKLCLQFPEPYIAFLSCFGYASWFGHSIYGYSDDEDYQVVAYTHELRNYDYPSDFQKIRVDGCVIESYGGGGYFFLFSKESERSGQVALFLDELYGQEAQSWECFEKFLEYMISL